MCVVCTFSGSAAATCVNEVVFKQGFNLPDDEVMDDAVPEIGCEDFSKLGASNAKSVRVADLVGVVIEVI